MAYKIRVLDSANRTMQRPGFLKMLCAIVNETETSNLDSIGRRLIERVSRRMPVALPADEPVRDYVKNRMTDGIFRELRKSVLENGNGEKVLLEVQDFHLSDRSLPSRTGRLVKSDWRKYPYLGTSLDLIKKGTWSALTRSHVLLSVTPETEMAGFSNPSRGHNPLLLSDAQALVLFHCFLENDSDVTIPLFQTLASQKSPAFNEREAGELLPGIFKKIIKDNQNRNKTLNERSRLAQLGKIAQSIDEWKNKSYTGGGATQNNIRARLEPYCDFGIFGKPNPDRYDYQATDALRVFLAEWGKDPDPVSFLQNRYFAVFASMRGIKVRNATRAQATEALAKAGETLKSPLGYTPITDVGLLAGIRLLTEKKRRLELGKTLELLKALQKRDPDFVRFTVDRMGEMAHVKFLKPKPGNTI